MKRKNVILKNESYLQDVTELNLGRWSRLRQKKFLKNLFEPKPRDRNSDDFCKFDIFYDDNAIELTCGNELFDYGPFKNCADTEFVIEISPSSFILFRDDNTAVKCGIKSAGECIKCIQNGKCVSPRIINNVGKFLFPVEYGNCSLARLLMRYVKQYWKYSILKTKEHYTLKHRDLEVTTRTAREECERTRAMILARSSKAITK